MAAVDLDKENHAPGTTGKLDNAPMRAHGALRVLRTAEKLRVEDSIQSKVSPLQVRTCWVLSKPHACQGVSE